MRTTNGLLKTSMLLGFFAVMPSTGCIAPTVVGGNNDTSSSSSDTTSVMSSVGGGPATNAVAIRAGSTWGSGGGSPATSVVATSVGVGGSGGGFPMTAGAGGAPQMTSASGAGGSMTAGVTVGTGSSMSGVGGASMTSGVGGAPDMTSGVGGGPSYDPDTLFLEIDSNPITCLDPNSLDDAMACADGTHVHIELPPAAQAVGAYHFNDGSGVTVFGSIALPDCGGGGGNFFDEVNVLAITPTSITVQITGVISTDGYDPNGLYIIPRCEPGAVAPTSGIAIHPSDLPQGTGGSTSVGTGGAPPSTTDLILVVQDENATDVAAVCSDPFGVDCSTAGWEVSFTLPLDKQVPGIYSLEDLNATSGEWDQGCNSGGGGSFWGGSVEVKSVGPMGIVARFLGDLQGHDILTTSDIFYARCDQN